MKQPKPNKHDGWTTLLQEIQGWDAAQLTSLIKALYETDAENRQFIQARCNAGKEGEEGGAEILEAYRQKITKQFFPKAGEAKLNLAEAQKNIRDYRRATGSIPGTAELMMTFVENGALFTREYGDIDEDFYDSVESVLEELAKLFRSEAREHYPKFSARFSKLEQISDGVGWGFHDYIADVVYQLEKDLNG
ncbi:MAG: hypothetical protein K8R57_03500 [Verrucomicrobia bacterium]|nr:hypothetical protein [Verrucomicrobiota bacterium]